MRGKKNFIIIAILLSVWAIGTCYADHDSYLAIINNEVETEFAPYEPISINVDPKQSNYIILEDFSNVENFRNVANLLNDKSKALLLENGFAVVLTPQMNEGESHRMYSIYGDFKKRGIPLFITTDSMLHTFHILYDYSLRVSELENFMGNINTITEVMLSETSAQMELCDDPFVSDAVKRNYAYFAVAMKLLDPDYVVPESINELVDGEIALIDAHEGKECSPIFGYFEDYSQYVPRGHYTRSEEFKKYFRGMMWYGRMMYRLKPVGSTMNCDEVTKYQETLRAILICQGLLRGNSGETHIEELWEKIYQPTVFFVGKSDDLSFSEYRDLIAEIYGDDYLNLDPDEFYDEAKLDQFIDKAMDFQDPRINSSFVFETEDAEIVTKGFRFMGQRFIPDSYMLGQMVHKYVVNRMMPRGLDVMAILGSARALQILDYHYRETVNPTYMPQITKLRGEFSSLNNHDWVQNLYWNWLYTLFPCMTSKGEGFPIFMTNSAWEDKELNTALGSWTELRHDTILYAKQSYTFETGMPITQKCYVEPNPELFNRLASLSNFMRNGLGSRGLLNSDFDAKFRDFSIMQEKLTEVARKELAGEAITDDEYDYIFGLNDILEMIETFPDDNPYQNNEDTQVALVADVHTDPNSASVLEEAIGNPDTIIVITPLDDKLYAYAGPVFSYYEFHHPMSDRLTDGSWQEMLEKGENPMHPCWFESFYSDDVQPLDNEVPISCNVRTNDTYLNENNTLKAYISIKNKDASQDIDLYMGILLPNEELIFLPGLNMIAEPVSLSLDRESNLEEIEFLSIPITDMFPEGSYKIYCGISKSGKLEFLDRISVAEFIIK